MRKVTALTAMVLLLGIFAFSAAAADSERTALRVIIVPKFEIGEITGDFPGEAQLFYDHYTPGLEETELPHLPKTAHLFVNEETGVAILVTGSGKSAAGISLTVLLSSDRFDCSDAYIVSVGCSGGSPEVTTCGDIVLVTAACDYDLGHQPDSSDLADPDYPVTWFPIEPLGDSGHKNFNPELCETVYRMIRDCPLRTTELTKKILAENFPEQDRVKEDPKVIKGTALTGDNFWKGKRDHLNAVYIAEYYGAPDPFAVTEMEEIAIADAADCFGMLDRVISLRVVVNMDQFLGTEKAEELWGGKRGYSEKVSEANSETLDIFRPAMHNLFDAAGIVIDAILAGDL